MAKVYAPNKQYTGLSAGVHFVNGIGETDDPHLIEWFKDKGYTVEEFTKADAMAALEPIIAIAKQNELLVEQTSDSPEQLGIDDLTKDQIKVKLDELGIEYTSNENKDVLFEKMIDAMED